ncbi:MAG: hypothetical protein FD126_1121 [Elusimicrobia bacterium]|nr:MAG: hypothetical protein FD126_1121 [Elusimicrobiota bacterium]
MNEHAALAARVLEVLTGPGASRAGLTAWELKMRLKAPHTALHIALGMLVERGAVTLTPAELTLLVQPAGATVPKTPSQLTA